MTRTPEDPGLHRIAARPLVVGLTGGIGSGKSTVAAMFDEIGVPVIDTDAIAHSLTQPGLPATAEIANAFGNSVLDDRGGLNRAALRTIVFGDSAMRQKLEGILHPRIRAEVQRQLATRSGGYVIVVVPLLVESGFNDLVDRVLVIDADESEQIARVRARNGWTEEAVRQVMAAQISNAKRLRHADDVISNSSDLAHLRGEVRRLDKRYRTAGRELER